MAAAGLSAVFAYSEALLSVNLTYTSSPLLLLSLDGIQSSLTSSFGAYPLDAAWAAGQSVSARVVLHQTQGLQSVTVAASGSWNSGQIATALGLYGSTSADAFSLHDPEVSYSSSPVALRVSCNVDMPVLQVNGSRAVLEVGAGRALKLQVGGHVVAAVLHARLEATGPARQCACVYVG
jgi:hypothetical protein